MNNNQYCVILAGGIGIRLWPTSREKKPKQFQDILNTGKSMLQTTYARFCRFINPDNIIIVSNVIYEDIIREQLPDLKRSNLMLEPMRRNTVPSVTWAALEVFRRNRNAVMVVSPTDQLIDKEVEFENDIVTGLEYAENNERLLTLGIAPKRPATEFGYIQMSDKMGHDIYKVRSFTEKPEEDFAKVFYESGEFLWNTGIFIWGASTFLKAVHGKNMELTAVLEAIAKNYVDKDISRQDVENIYSKVPNMNLEQSVLEKSDNVDVLQCHFGWKDVGTWQAVHDVMPKDAESNVVIDSQSLLYDCKNCVVKLPNGHVAVIQGLEDYMVVEEGDVLVICKKDDQKAIRKFVVDAQMKFGDEFV
ncbi:MAG: mannose-1-phosphate guanylyltransferase [Bacteroidaceae bacterium]|nr:mannose-1-phosphate guanylyltransferase [Bacteroidaceae bacterium]